MEHKGKFPQISLKKLFCTFLRAKRRNCFSSLAKLNATDPKIKPRAREFLQYHQRRRAFHRP
ncbi:hypothetical protein SAMN05443582_101415 [Phyllobacterium sp. OV277]|nr:hypothetical protein SAMN05443582_101415 [Phyllobacterium sp. OV277]